MRSLGALDRRVALDAPVVGDDGSGGVETGWERQFEAWASFRWLRGGERVQSARLQGVQPAVITLRANMETRRITSDWRLLDIRGMAIDDDRIISRGMFNIRTAIETEDRQWIELTAETGVAA